MLFSSLQDSLGLRTCFDHALGGHLASEIVDQQALLSLSDSGLVLPREGLFLTLNELPLSLFRIADHRLQVVNLVLQSFDLIVFALDISELLGALLLFNLLLLAVLSRSFDSVESR